MNLKRSISKRINHLKNEEKLVALAGLVTIAGCFFPWRMSIPTSAYKTVNPNSDYSWIETWADGGFWGQTWLIGYFIAILTIISIVVVFRTDWESVFKRMNIGRMWIPFVLGFESFLFALIATSVLNTKGVDQELGFGLFITILGTAFITIGGFWGVRHSLRRRHSQTSEDFLHFPENETSHHEKPSLKPEDLDDTSENSEDEDSQQTLNL